MLVQIQEGKCDTNFTIFTYYTIIFFTITVLNAAKKQKQIHMENETGQAEWITFTIKSQFKIII